EKVALGVEVDAPQPVTWLPQPGRRLVLPGVGHDDEPQSFARHQLTDAALVLGRAHVVVRPRVQLVAQSFFHARVRTRTKLARQDEQIPLGWWNLDPDKVEHRPELRPRWRFGRLEKSSKPRQADQPPGADDAKCRPPPPYHDASLAPSILGPWTLAMRCAYSSLCPRAADPRGSRARISSCWRA